MMCSECKHFKYFSEPKTYDYPGSEDWECEMGHKIVKSRNDYYEDFVPAEECNDYEYFYRMTEEEAREDAGCRRYHELKDEGKI